MVKSDTKIVWHDTILRNVDFDFWQILLQSNDVKSTANSVYNVCKRMEWNEHILITVTNTLLFCAVNVLSDDCSESRFWDKEVMEAIERLAPHAVYKEPTNGDMIIFSYPKDVVLKYYDGKYMKADRNERYVNDIHCI